jgi:hypothetical protein
VEFAIYAKYPLLKLYASLPQILAQCEFGLKDATISIVEVAPVILYGILIYPVPVESVLFNLIPPPLFDTYDVVPFNVALKPLPEVSLQTAPELGAEAKFIIKPFVTIAFEPELGVTVGVIVDVGVMVGVIVLVGVGVGVTGVGVFVGVILGDGGGPNKLTLT